MLPNQSVAWGPQGLLFHDLRVTVHADLKNTLTTPIIDQQLWNLELQQIWNPREHSGFHRSWAGEWHWKHSHLVWRWVCLINRVPIPSCDWCRYAHYVKTIWPSPLPLLALDDTSDTDGFLFDSHSFILTLASWKIVPTSLLCQTILSGRTPKSELWTTCYLLRSIQLTQRLEKPSRHWTGLWGQICSIYLNPIQ